jgi:GWxTD domain-containing protein
MKPDVAQALLRAASRLISTPALFCFISALGAQTISSNWAETDVAYIITDQERGAFNRLLNDNEREKFVEQFWLRRDPTPDTVENEFKEEHYRRIAYANERFGAGVPGWKTDRGWIYIKFGPPDQIESHPGESYQRPLEQGGGTTSTYPFEQWRYRHLNNIGNVFEFIDHTNAGEYRLIVDPTDKYALANLRGDRAPFNNVGVGILIIGDVQMRPRPGAIFANDEKLGFYVQLYHFVPDPITHKASGSIEYQVVNNSHQTVLNYTEDVSDIPGATSRVVVEKLIPLASFAPGSYTLKLRVTDRIRNQTISPSADFTVIPSALR